MLRNFSKLDEKDQHLLDSQINFPEISQRKLSIFQNIVFEKLKKLATS